MSRAQLPAPTPPEPTGSPLAWITDLVRQGRLAWKLFWDSRVPFWIKLIPPAMLLYILSPADLLPDVALGLGQLDDIAILLLGTKLFIDLAPTEIVREHLVALGARIKEWRVADEEEPPMMVEGEYEITEIGPIENGDVVEEVEAEIVEPEEPDAESI